MATQIINKISAGADIGGEVHRLYQAALNRAPGKDGLGFWISAMDGGLSLTQALSESSENQAASIKLIGEGFGYQPHT